MSVEAMNFVWRHSRAATPAEVSVLVALADWADAWGYCYASYPALAEKARVSERQAQRVVAKFTDLHEITRDIKGHRVSAPGHRPGRTGLQARNHYRFTCVADEESHDTMSPLPAVEAVTPCRRSGDTMSPQEVTPRPAHIRKNRQINRQSKPSGPRLAFAGTRIEVPKFLHEKFTKQLGANGAPLFDLLTWYTRLDTQDEGPIVGNLLTFIEHAFAEETKRVFGSRRVGAPRLAYADWICPHLPPCTHPSRCQQLQDIAAEKARVTA